ncbi:Spore germination protein XA [compost metagenome]
MSIAVRIVRFGMMLMAGAFGLVGIFTGTVLLMLHLTSLRSMGVSYMTPLSPSPEGEWKDTILRAPWPSMRKRPSTARHGNRNRQAAKGRNS